jgi:hypothetical protein
MNYELKVTETKNKAGKFHYQVIDENGTIISERKSNREYAACTAGGGYYFGRLDLIGKGEHGMALRHTIKNLALTKYPYQTLPKGIDNIEDAFKWYIEATKGTLENLNRIAYRK